MTVQKGLVVSWKSVSKTPGVRCHTLQLPTLARHIHSCVLVGLGLNWRETVVLHDLCLEYGGWKKTLC